MTEESGFVAVALATAEKILQAPLLIKRGAALLYQVTVDNTLALTVDPKRPMRGDSAFQTDLCVFEQKADVLIPRVVLEFKTNITTHDVITYSAKARKHKQVYPYLRYGVVISKQKTVPGRLFVHNESLDFAAALDGMDAASMAQFFERLFSAEIDASKCLEQIAFGTLRPRLYRTAIRVDAA